MLAEAARAVPVCEKHRPSIEPERSLVGALLVEQNDEWLLTRGYLSQESSPWSSRTRAMKTKARWRP